MGGIIFQLTPCYCIAGKRQGQVVGSVTIPGSEHGPDLQPRIELLDARPDRFDQLADQRKAGARE